MRHTTSCQARPSRPRHHHRVALFLFARRLTRPVETLRLLLPKVLPAPLRARILGGLGKRAPRLPVPQDEAERAALIAQWEACAQLLAAPRVSLPLVSVIVVTFGNRVLTELCLESVRIFSADVEHEVVVVDNGSTDDNPEYLQSLVRVRPNLKFVLNPENRGFAAAVNQGVRVARGEVLCLLNNDTIVTPTWLATLAGAVHAEPDVGLVGPVSNAVHNEARVRCGYRNLAELPMWAARRSLQLRGKSFAIPMLALFCAVLRREVWEAVGPLDEQFGIGMFEDDDYSRRVREAGYTLVCRRDVFVHHWQRAGFSLLGDDAYLQLYEENRARFRAKWGG